MAQPVRIRSDQHPCPHCGGEVTLVELGLVDDGSDPVTWVVVGVYCETGCGR